MLLLQANRDDILRPLQSVIGVVERRNTLPILSNVLIEKNGGGLSFVATDLEIQISATATVGEIAGIDFAVTVSARKLQDICRAFPENAQLTAHGDDSRLQLQVGKSRFHLQTLPAEDFPRISPIADDKTALKVSQNVLRRLLNEVQYAMAQQDIRYYLNGMLMVVGPQQLTVVATDGHRLAYANSALDQGGDGPVPESQEVILPRKTVLELLKLLGDSDDEVRIEIGRNQIRFTFANIELVSKIVEGKFPDYTKVIPTGYRNTFQIDRIAMLQALQRAAILSNEKFRGVRLVLTQNSLRIFCSNTEQEEAQEELEIAYAGDPLDIGFNVNYLLDVLNHQDSTVVEWAFGDASSSGLITVPGNAHFKYVVMPMRI
jgi:DNA polymerase-3 subunit beta